MLNEGTTGRQIHYIECRLYVTIVIGSSLQEWLLTYYYMKLKVSSTLSEIKLSNFSWIKINGRAIKIICTKHTRLSHLLWSLGNCPSHLQITGSVNLQICNFLSLFMCFCWSSSHKCQNISLSQKGWEIFWHLWQLLQQKHKN